MPDALTTRAVTVDAPASAICPWLVQMGSERGGAYTCDWVVSLFHRARARLRPKHEPPGEFG